MPDHLQLNEAETRYNLIDPLLIKAGWNLDVRRNVDFGIPINTYNASQINGIADSIGWYVNGCVCAIEIGVGKYSADAGQNGRDFGGKSGTFAALRIAAPEEVVQEHGRIIN